MLLAHALMQSDDARLGAQRRAAARLLPLQWDLYMRPSEALELSVADCFPPLRRGQPWAVVVRASLVCDEGDNQDMLDAMQRRPRSKPAKTGEDDGTVLLGDPASVQQRRGWLREHLRLLIESSDGRITNLTLPQYNAALRWASDAAGLSSLGLTAHPARHGGPSHDAAEGARTIAEIKARGQWTADRKSGMLRRHLARMSPEQRALAD